MALETNVCGCNDEIKAEMEAEMVELDEALALV